MRSDIALHHLLDALEAYEQSLYDGEPIDPSELQRACQNFQRAGQNFDDPASEDRALPADHDGHSGRFEAADLELLHARLGRTISAVELSMESVQDELGAISRGRRALRGYQSLQSISSAQYLSYNG
jgi:hypothetical protein